jgi:transcriptional regulator with XRE-family HTH domain
MARLGIRLKAVRERKGLTQAQLAKAVRVSQAYVAKLEGGEKANPSLLILQRLSKALGVTADKLLESNMKATTIYFDLNHIFPSTDSQTTPLLRLLMATDDLRHLQKLCLVAPDTVQESCESDYLIFNGEVGHLHRLLCSHLHEAGIAFRNIEEKSPRRLEALLAGDVEASTALQRVHAAFDPKNQDTFWYTFLRPIRQCIGFHYNDKNLRQVFEKHRETGALEGAVILVSSLGLGRYLLIDRLATLLIVEKIFGGDFNAWGEQYPKMMKEAVCLAGDLVFVVDSLFGRRLESCPGATLDVKEESISVSPALARAVERIAKERAR